MLLIRDSRGAYYQSIYLDDHGEEDAREYVERTLLMRPESVGVEVKGQSKASHTVRQKEGWHSFGTALVQFDFCAKASISCTRSDRKTGSNTSRLPLF